MCWHHIKKNYVSPPTTTLVASSQPLTDWYLDSGASFYLTHNIGSFLFWWCSFFLRYGSWIESMDFCQLLLFWRFAFATVTLPFRVLGSASFLRSGSLLSRALCPLYHNQANQTPPKAHQTNKQYQQPEPPRMDRHKPQIQHNQRTKLAKDKSKTRELLLSCFLFIFSPTSFSNIIPKSIIFDINHCRKFRLLWQPVPAII